MVTVSEVEAEATFDLRSRVLREGRPHHGFPEDALPGTFHLAVLDGDQLVGAATFVPGEAGWWQLRGMAVHAERQRGGIGRALLEEAERRLRDAGAAGMWANARDVAIGFYERAGWYVVGDGYDIVGMPHHRMERPFAAGR